MPKTYNEIFIEVRRGLRAIDTSQSSLEARLLLALASGKTKEELTRDMGLYATDDVVTKAQRLLQRRETGEPLAYISGDWEFYGLPFRVTPNVLIPRMDTEVVAATAIDYAKTLLPGARVLDLCCGSGCIGIAIAASVPTVKVTMADISKEALKLAKENAVLNNVSGHTACVQVDVLEPPKALLGKFDLIVCNPPYIPTADINGLDTSVKAYEPRQALDGGDDGLDCYRSVALLWRRVLNPGGRLILECGVGQHYSVKYLLTVNGYEEIEILNDTGEIERVAVGRRPSKQREEYDHGR